MLYRRPLGAGEVVYFTLGHCRSHWDMVDPPHNGARWPTIDRGSWDVPEFVEIVRRAIDWAEGRHAVGRLAGADVRVSRVVDGSGLGWAAPSGGRLPTPPRPARWR